MTRLYESSLGELASALQDRRVTALEAVDACLGRITATEPSLHALISIQGEEAKLRAKELDAQGPQPDQPLWGVPIILKDLLAVKGAPTTCGSKILENFVPVYDAHVVEKLKAAGAILIGKANMDEFAMGSSTENSAFHTTANPWDLKRAPGGSSGGSAASVAAGQCFAALGTDTGGSIRLPASYCGVFGLKPSYGRVSRYGLVAYGSSLDQIGPLTRTVEDAARVLQAIAGHDPRDSTSVNAEVPDYLAALSERRDLKGITIGLPEEYWSEGNSPEVSKACQWAVDNARELGATLKPVSLKLTEYAVAAYYIIAMAEASSNLARFDGVRYGFRDKEASELIDMYTSSRTKGFGDEVQRRIIIGTYVLSAGYYDAYYRKAAKVRRLIRQDFDRVLGECDVLAGPVCPVTAFPLGEKVSDPLTMYLMDEFTVSLNLAGLPGASLPVGLGRDSSMPVGLQLIGRSFDESLLLSVAGVLERNLPRLPAPRGLA
ncbi:MAG: aspartyl-tRNA(Asn)/glutamyl-tRNA(Gln) amidotransferase subunit [Desulfovibrionales bacterium]|nr:aspartyl-tRNA(Asn)/glutamyl-tRNA(Gln) amidotransferase subunit [Desulfovibrionales bacterium]